MVETYSTRGEAQRGFIKWKDLLRSLEPPPYLADVEFPELHYKLNAD